MKSTACPLRIAFLASSLFIAGSANAEWITVGRNESFRAYLDQNSLQKDGKLVRVVQLMDFVTAQWADERTVVGSIRAQVEYDCERPRSRTLVLEAFSEQMADGRLVATERMPSPEWENVQPDSTNEKIRLLVCRK